MVAGTMNVQCVYCAVVEAVLEFETRTVSALTVAKTKRTTPLIMAVSIVGVFAGIGLLEIQRSRHEGECVFGL